MHEFTKYIVAKFSYSELIKKHYMNKILNLNNSLNVKNRNFLLKEENLDKILKNQVKGDSHYIIYHIKKEDYNSVFLEYMSLTTKSKIVNFNNQYIIPHYVSEVLTPQCNTKNQYILQAKFNISLSRDEYNKFVKTYQNDDPILMESFVNSENINDLISNVDVLLNSDNDLPIVNRNIERHSLVGYLLSLDKFSDYSIVKYENLLQENLKKHQEIDLDVESKIIEKTVKNLLGDE